MNVLGGPIEVHAPVSTVATVVMEESRSPLDSIILDVGLNVGPTIWHMSYELGVGLTSLQSAPKNPIRNQRNPRSNFCGHSHRASQLLIGP